MKQFTFSDLSRRSGDVLDTAMVEPVSLVKRGKPKVVMMPIAQYERLLGQERRRAFTLANAPEGDIENLMTGFQEIIDEAQHAEE
jgi:prevent-host-death family protein